METSRRQFLIGSSVVAASAALTLQPAIAALFANSPFTDGKLNGLLSARSEIWRHTDPARTGMLPFAFEPGMGFERYVDYALDVPLYFVKRGDHYQDVAGASFRDLLAGRLDVFADAARHLVLPAVTLSLGGLATIARFTRAGVLETLQKDFVSYERAQGIPARALIWKFVLKNSVVASITQIGLLFGGLIAGAVVVETIFDWPGIGFYTVQAILTADYKVMLAVTLLIGVIYTAVNILVDLVHGLIDPRLREQL